MENNLLTIDPYTKKIGKKYGEPITIQGASLEIADSQRNGVCNANETSLAALDNNRMYWGYYAMSAVNDSMLVYWLEMHPRIISSKIIKGSEGGLIIPGIIYTESDYPIDGVSRIHETIMEQGTRHVAPSGQRGDFATLHLPEATTKYALTPLREIETGPVTTRSLNGYIDENTVANVLMKAKYEAINDEDELYQNLHNNISAYFDDPEEPDLIRKIVLNKFLTPSGEINMPVAEAVKRGDSSIVFNPGAEFDAIKDPISWNNHGQEVFIINAEGKYYFCPKADCEVIK